MAGVSGARSLELPGLTGPEVALLVGRSLEFAELEKSLARASDGTRQVVFVAGEAGIGKTSLVRAFMAGAAGAVATQLAWGQSAEHYGPSEPYHPILDAVTRACRAGNVTLLKAFEVHAPLWLAQMPSLLSTERLRSVERRCAGATRERMQRELTDALEMAAERIPLAVWLEDLHWADAPTVEWLASFARRPDRARVLVVATFRPSAARAEVHPLYALRDELLRQGRVRMVSLEALDREAVEAYVAARFDPLPGATRALAHLAGRVFERTGGSPLFMVGMLNELVSRRLLYPVGRQWSVAGDAAEAALAVPSYLRELIGRQFDRLAPDEVSLLEAASVAGLHFCAALLASVTDRSVLDTDCSCARMSRDWGLLVSAGVEAWPDGTFSTRYGFAHALHREVLASRLPAGLAMQVHRRVGERLSAAYKGFEDEVAGQLALHFEQGRELAAAVEWLQKAGDAALASQGGTRGCRTLRTRTRIVGAPATNPAMRRAAGFIEAGALRAADRHAGHGLAGSGAQRCGGTRVLRQTR
jgi:predicted ATPase